MNIRQIILQYKVYYKRQKRALHDSSRANKKSKICINLIKEHKIHAAKIDIINRRKKVIQLKVVYLTPHSQ